MNQTALTRLGQDKKDLLGRHFKEVFDGAACPGREDRCDSPLDTTMRTGEPSEAVQSEVDAGGRMRYYRIYAYPIYDEGRLIHLVAMRRDIPRRTEMEQRLQQSEKLASNGQLSTYIAHEIRNPLFAISGFANSLLRQGNQDEASREKLGIILEESKRLDTILKSILNFTRPTEARDSAMNVNRVVEDTLEILAADCERAGARVSTVLAGNLAQAKADPELIKQCLINLVRNAIEAMPDGGRIVIRTSMIRDMVALEVQDTGQGIPWTCATRSSPRSSPPRARARAWAWP